MNADVEHAFGNLIISKCLERREAEKAYYFYKAMNSYAICKERKELLRRDKSMKLSRTDYALMKVLKSHNCTTYFSGMTMQEIMSVLGISRSSAYRKLNSLIDEGYIEKACKSINADTFCITQAGINFIEKMGGVVEDAER